MPWQNVLSRRWWHSRWRWSLNFKSIRTAKCIAILHCYHAAGAAIRNGWTLNTYHEQFLSFISARLSFARFVFVHLVQKIFYGKNFCANSISKVCSSDSMMATTAAAAAAVDDWAHDYDMRWHHAQNTDVYKMHVQRICRWFDNFFFSKLLFVVVLVCYFYWLLSTTTTTMTTPTTTLALRVAATCANTNEIRRTSRIEETQKREAKWWCFFMQDAASIGGCGGWRVRCSRTSEKIWNENIYPN